MDFFAIYEYDMKRLYMASLTALICVLFNDLKCVEYKLCIKTVFLSRRDSNKGVIAKKTLNYCETP